MLAAYAYDVESCVDASVLERLTCRKLPWTQENASFNPSSCTSIPKLMPDMLVALHMWLPVSGVSNQNSQTILSTVENGTLDKSVESQLAASGISSTVGLVGAPKVIKPPAPQLPPGPSQGVSDSSNTGSGAQSDTNINPYGSRSASNATAAKSLPMGEMNAFKRSSSAGLN
jgi:hypothetical protein